MNRHTATSHEPGVDAGKRAWRNCFRGSGLMMAVLLVVLVACGSPEPAAKRLNTESAQSKYLASVTRGVKLTLAGRTAHILQVFAAIAPRDSRDTQASTARGVVNFATHSARYISHAADDEDAHYEDVYVAQDEYTRLLGGRHRWHEEIVNTSDSQTPRQILQDWLRMVPHSSLNRVANSAGGGDCLHARILNGTFWVSFGDLPTTSLQRQAPLATLLDNIATCVNARGQVTRIRFGERGGGGDGELLYQYSKIGQRIRVHRPPGVQLATPA